MSTCLPCIALGMALMTAIAAFIEHWQLRRKVLQLKRELGHD